MSEPAPELTVIMPVFNERRTVERAIHGVLDAGLPVDLELLVVDDGSFDGTSELLARSEWPARVRILRHERNRGKGVAIRTALAEARGRYTTIMDADLEYNPADVPCSWSRFVPATRLSSSALVPSSPTRPSASGTSSGTAQ